MSYILDALRRADAERQQGQVPGLHAHAEPLGRLARLRGRSARRWAGGCVAALALLVLLAAWLLRPPTAATPTALVPGLPPAPNPAGRAEQRPAPLPIVVSSPPTSPPPALAAVPGQAQSPSSATPSAAPPAALPANTASASSLSVSLQQLGADQRRELPPLVVGGSVWSDSPAARFVILDGQVIREGESVASGLVLERILPKSALLRWRGMLLEIKL